MVFHKHHNFFLTPQFLPNTRISSKTPEFLLTPTATTTMPIHFPIDDFATLGLLLAGYSENTITKTCNATNDGRLKDF